MSLLTPQLVMLFLGLGLLSGLVGGLLGLGGGVVLVPALLLTFLYLDFPAAMLMHMSVATSLATIVFTAAVATWVHHRNRRLSWPLVAMMVPGIVIGSVLGAMLASSVSSEHLRRLFGIMELLVAVQIGTGIMPHAMRGLPPPALMLPASGGIGFLSTLMGIGGGSFSVPFLVFCKVHLKQAIAVSSACGLPIALTGVASMVALSHAAEGLPPGTIGYLYWPAALCVIMGSTFGAHAGARLLHILPINVVRRTFAVVLAMVGVAMII